MYEDLEPEFTESCALCGFALHSCEIAADIRGEFTDFFRKTHGDVGIVFCADCWGKLQEMVNIEMRTAIAKRRVLESLDRSDTKDKNVYEEE